jgi:hypothetical protein
MPGYEIYLDFFWRKILIYDLYNSVIIKLFTTKHIKISSVIWLDKMGADIAGSDKLHEAVALFWITW